MIDVQDIIRDYLLTVPEITALTSTRIYAGRDVPPANYALADGACITFRVRGGNEDYEGAIFTPSVQFKCYGATEYLAGTLYRAVDDALHKRPCNGAILHGERDTHGQTLEEPGTQWPFTLAFYTLMVRNQ